MLLPPPFRGSTDVIYMDFKEKANVSHYAFVSVTQPQVNE